MILETNYLILMKCIFMKFIDCYKEKKILQSPFLASGNSHGHNIENEEQIGTISWDIVLPQLRRKYDQNDTDGAHIIGIEGIGPTTTGNDARFPRVG